MSLKKIQDGVPSNPKPATPPPSPSIKESKAVPSPPKQATPPSQTQQGSNK